MPKPLLLSGSKTPRPGAPGTFEAWGRGKHRPGVSFLQNAADWRGSLLRLRWQGHSASDAPLLNQISEIAALVKQAAYQAGFELAGIAPVRDLPELNRFPDWIEAGHAGEMKYLEARDDAGQFKRASLRSTAPWARSVIVCAINYNTAHPYSTQLNDPERGWISRYAW